MKIIDIEKNNNKIKFITDDEYAYSFIYYSPNKWIDDNKLILVRNKEEYSDMESFLKNTDLVIVDLQKGTEEVIINSNDFGGITAVLPYENTIYFGVTNKLYSYNMQTKTTTLLVELDELIEAPEITNDGNFISFFTWPKDANDFTKAYVFDVKNSKLKLAFRKNFSKPFYSADHVMICPTDKDKIFFAHEGDTFYVSNRLWLYQKDKGMHCIAKQNLDEEGNLGDCFGHECWAHDGKGLYFVKYKCSPKPPTGICYVDTSGNQTDVLYGKYPYWHVSTSKNGRFLASDTQSDTFSGVCLLDTKTATERMLFEANTNWTHPCHPHPMISPDDTKLCFHHLYDGKLGIGIIDIAKYK